MARPRKKIPTADEVEEAQPDPWEYIAVWGSDPDEMAGAAKGLISVEILLNMETGDPWMGQILKVVAGAGTREARVIREDFAVEAVAAETIGKARYRVREAIDWAWRKSSEESA